jgi:hypothetical protein
MRILHMMAGAKNGDSEAIMLDSVLALAEAGVAQHVVTRDDDAMRLRALNAASIPYTIADFDKFVRAPTAARLHAVARGFEPDVLHYWLARAAAFAEPKWREISVGWHAGAHHLEHFKNCAWRAVATPQLSERLIADGIAENRVAILAPYEPKRVSKAAFVRSAMTLYERVRANAKTQAREA